MAVFMVCSNIQQTYYNELSWLHIEHTSVLLSVERCMPACTRAMACMQPRDQLDEQTYGAVVACM
jgi:hypothetical protein